MACCAVSFRIKLFIHKTLVDILMTIEAPDSNIPEVPVFGFLMTGNAGDCKVCSFKNEFSLVVLFNGESELIEPFGGMTIGAVLHNAELRELVVVIILMTVSAPVILYWGR